MRLEEIAKGKQKFLALSFHINKAVRLLLKDHLQIKLDSRNFKSF